MTGSSMATIVIPIVVAFVLAAMTQGPGAVMTAAAP
jgi:hypothetical protein